MYPLFESIKIRNGEWINLEAHQMRMNQARQKLYDPVSDLELKPIELSPEFQVGVVKCRLPYGKSLGEPTFAHYRKKSIRSIQMVNCEYFDYQLKYQDRTKIEQLYAHRGACDEILICIDDLITDTSYTNVALFDGRDWWTPANPLLPGTQRERLLKRGLVGEKLISSKELSRYKSMVLINAMQEFEPAEKIPVAHIIPWESERINF